MIYPIAVYNYLQSDSESRMNLLKIDDNSIEVPELTFTLSRGKDKGKECIRIGKPKNKAGSKEQRTEIALSSNKKKLGELHPELIKNGKYPESISNIYEPSIDNPGQGYGDIQGTNHAFLSVRHPENKSLKLMVFENWKTAKETLFKSWLAEGVEETIPDNKENFTPQSDKQP